ncbi:rho guanine nucleotide exchange factor 6-like isoform X2 [Pseudophryne corroboree]|uniref:rho guanine nucleotide exchange factor 6-like isoform X2 n=1 Tax=Pseudophryne corroboree TaxID=495146 RepID=UPI0030816001
MGCCSVSARGTKTGSDGHEEVELLQKEWSRNQSAVNSPCTSPNGGLCCIPQDLAGTIMTPGKADSHTIHTQFVSKGLLPLSGMRVVYAQTKTGYTFELSGPMIEPRQVSCLSSSERSLWISALQQHIQEANTHCSPASHPISILSYLIPCDQLWKKRELVRYLTSCPIQNWEGKAIQHMGSAVYLSAVQAAHTIDGDFEDRLMILFPEDLVFLCVDTDRAAVIHQGTLPLNAIHIEESLAWNENLEFQIAGDLMEPILIFCPTPEDYSKWVFYLQKPQHINHCGVGLHPPFVQPKYRRR